LALARAAIFSAALVAAACSSGDSTEASFKPSFVGNVVTTTYDGTSDDLLTAGLGRTGLASAVPPTVSTPPTAAELRRLAIYTNYRALLDMTAAGGYGVFYGPNVDANGVAGTGEGRIAGVEAIAYADDGSGRQNVTLMVQIPSSFNPAAPCMITATSSGSRGVYGAIATGEWGLKRGCAVAYTDKGTGAAPHDLQANTVARIDGTRGDAAAVGSAAHFRAPITEAQRASFNAVTPNRLAFKHAHSQQNPEKDWGQHTLQAVQFAFWVLNERYGPLLPNGLREAVIRPANTVVIASSISNGGGAALAAAEIDRAGLIDGVAVSEPQIQMPAGAAVQVQRGNTTLATVARPLYDYTTQANLLQICASQAPSVAGAPGSAFIVPAWASARCAALAARGLVNGATLTDRAEDALARLQAYGWEPEAAILHASHAAFEIASAVSVTYANAHSRASVTDNLCGYSFAAADGTGAVIPANAAQVAAMFSTGNGVPPQASPNVQLINNNSVGVPLRDAFSFSPSSGVQDYNADGAACLRDLLTGTTATASALRAGIAETTRSGRLGGKPTLIVHGRADALVPVSHTSRPYAALSRSVDPDSRLSYIEVTNAQHFDGFIGLPAILPGYDTRYVPLHVYLNRALDALYAHLTAGAALPASQVVRTVPRGGTPGAAPALAPANLPPIATTPAPADAITFSGSTIRVPD
jgi:hydroxybutyrate-dimer hydrolase